MTAETVRDTGVGVWAALAVSALMIGFQTAAKATRDALFLSTFEIEALPTMVIAAALTSVLLTLYFARIMRATGPGRLVAWTFSASAVLVMVEWLALPWIREPIAVLFYLHYAGIGALLISGFWSIVSERFDPRTAKRQVGRIAAAGTIGGLGGGLLAERMAVLVTVEAMLPVLAGIHAACAIGIVGSRLGAGPRRAGASGGESESELPSGLKTIVERPHLRNLVLLVVLAAIAEMFIDYVFKARASAAAADQEALLRFFAVVYTGIGLLTVGVQAFATRPALQRLGLARTASLLPAVTAFGGLGALVAPGLWTATGARVGEIVTRNSLYRSAFEVLFTPLSPREKRATKSLIDVGVVRLGDVVGSVLVQGVLLMTVTAALPVMLGLAIVFSVVAFWVALRLHRGYVRSLERSLLSQGSHLDVGEITGLTTRTAFMETLGAVDLSALRAAVDVEPPPPEPRRDERPATVALDPDVARLAELRSRDRERVRSALAGATLSPGLVSQAIALLAWNDVARDAIAALRRVAVRHVGQLEDRLLDPDEEFTVRRRIPLVLAEVPTARVVRVLLDGLADPRFEVRYRCGRALNRIKEAEPGIAVGLGAVTTAIRREVAVDKGVWESRRLLDRLDDEEWSPVMDEVVRERADRSLEHVFTLLALVMPREPLKVAFHGLYTDDHMLRGTALEYLETALPEAVRGPLWPFLDDDRPTGRPRRPSRDVVDALLGSNHSITLNLEALRARGNENAD